MLRQWLAAASPERTVSLDAKMIGRERGCRLLRRMNRCHEKETAGFCPAASIVELNLWLTRSARST